VVVNPDEFQLKSRSVNKTDEHDAKVLSEVRMKEEVHARDNLVKVRTTLKNKVINLLLARGILIRKKGLAKVLASPVSELENAGNWISWLERFGT